MRPITSRKFLISERYLSEDERVTIAELRRQGWSMRAVALRTGRSPSTISRELRRNEDPERGQYRPFVAQKLAVDRRARPGRGKIVNDDALCELVSGLLTIAFPAEPARAPGARNDLPGCLPTRARRPAPRPAEGAADRASSPQAAPPCG